MSAVIVGVTAFKAFGRLNVSNRTCSCGNESWIWSECGGGCTALGAILTVALASVEVRTVVTRGECGGVDAGCPFAVDDGHDDGDPEALDVAVEFLRQTSQ